MSNLTSYSPEVLLREAIRRNKARSNFIDFVQFTMPTYQTNWHHVLLADYLQRFAEGKIKKLAVFMPPQHGKSELVSRRLPSYLLGINPNLKVIGCSYSADLSSHFNRDVQRIIDSPEYAQIFPNTQLNSANVRTVANGGYLRNSDVFEVVNAKGFYKSVGLGGSLTGTPADIGIIDDPVKDAQEADSPTYRARAWEWFTNVFLTRLHNDSQILVTQTRWNEDDLSGRILDRMKGWEVLSLPAINEHGPTDTDPRNVGEALWPTRHSLERILEIKQSNERAFHALFQQNPQPFTAGLVFQNWQYGWLEDGARAYGLDFGYSPDPLALVEVRIVGRALYIKQHIYRNGMSATDIVTAVQGVVQKGAPVYCDHRRDIIDDLFRKGVNAHAADKKLIDYGIKLMLSYDIYIESNSHDCIKEFKYFKFKEDKDGNAIGGAYSDTLNHAIDAIRYAVIGLLEYKKEVRGFEPYVLPRFVPG